MSSRKVTTGVKRSLDFGDHGETKEEWDPQDVVDLTSSSTNDTKAAAVTPVKKKQKKPKKDITDYFASPSAATASNSVATTPARASTSKAAVVTPPKEQHDDDDKTKNLPRETKDHVPIYIHKNVGYVREGESQLDAVTAKVFGLVESHYVIPEGFENNRQFGPISGVSFEQRVIAAYCNNLLEPVEEGVEICTACADDGHKKDDCPTLV